MQAGGENLHERERKNWACPASQVRAAQFVRTRACILADRAGQGAKRNRLGLPVDKRAPSTAHLPHSTRAAPLRFFLASPPLPTGEGRRGVAYRFLASASSPSTGRSASSLLRRPPPLLRLPHRVDLLRRCFLLEAATGARCFLVLGSASSSSPPPFRRRRSSYHRAEMETHAMLRAQAVSLVAVMY
ncbi:hypothetical protein EJB05_20348, partial [Eragrostis curvula]